MSRWRPLQPHAAAAAAAAAAAVAAAAAAAAVASVKILRNGDEYAVYEPSRVSVLSVC